MTDERTPDDDDWVLQLEQHESRSRQSDLPTPANSNGKRTRAEKPRLLDGVWKTVGERQWLDTQPPPQRWLLKRDDEETNGATRIGVLPQGEVGFFNAHGGVGKTYAMIQLGIAVATGRRWFDHFHVDSPGHVVLALGEDGIDQAHRRLWAAVDAMRLTDDQRTLVAERVVLMPLAGMNTALLSGEGAVSAETRLYHELRERLSEREWKLIVIDPLARFSAADTEKDNNAATRFVQAIETLTQSAGGATALIVHHKARASRVPGAPESSGGRGVTGLENAGRWSAELTSLSDDRVKFAVTKRNNAPPCPVLHLRRELRHAGCLRAETSAESKEQAAEVAATRTETKSAEIDADARELSKVLLAKPGLGTKQLRLELKDTGLHWGVERTESALLRLQRGVDGARAVDRSSTPLKHCWHVEVDQ